MGRRSTLIYIVLALTIHPFRAHWSKAEDLVKKFNIEASEIELTRAVQRGKFFDAIGRRAAILGYEEGTFEAWVYPFKIFHDFRLLLATRDDPKPLEAAKLAELITVRPEATTITYSHPAFTLRKTIFVPVDKEGAVILLDLDSSVPEMTIIAEFLIDLLPMWPAGLGGQYSYWNNELQAFVISEGSRKYSALVGCPLTSKHTLQPAHMLPDAPTQLQINVKREISRKHFIPIVIAAGTKGLDETKQTYRDLLRNVQRYYQESIAYYRRLRKETLQIQTPDSDLNMAFEWAKVATDKGFACNPHLGCGLVAGFGPSGNSARPGFAWYFGGDAFINSWAINSYGDFAVTRQALAFLRARQREDGKMMHELSQGASMIRWFEEYPYGYYHADTTPYYIIAMYDYLASSGDIDFIRESWPSIKKAYEYCLSTAGSNGLMENTKAGLGAMEVGDLLEVTYQDIYLAAVWTESLRALIGIAKILGENELEKKFSQQFDRARRSLNEDFWDPEKRIFAFALGKNMERVSEVTVWPAVAMWFGLTDVQKSALMLDKLASAEISTDWGARMISNKSSAYNPLHYNQGTVWPFLTGFASLAEYRHHRAIAGFYHLKNNADLSFAHALGFVPELLSGDFFRPLDTAVPHQLFSSTMVITPLVRGLLGLTGNALERVINFSPHLPAGWDKLKVENYRIGDGVFDFSLENKNGSLRLLVEPSSSKAYRLLFSPALAAGSEVKKVGVGGKELKFDVIETSSDTHCVVNVKLSEKTDIEIMYRGGVEIFPTYLEPKIGDRTRGLKIISASFDGERREYTVAIEGLNGREHILKLRLSPDLALKSIQGGELFRRDGDRLEVLVKFQDMSIKQDEYVRKIVRIRFG